MTHLNANDLKKIGDHVLGLLKSEGTLLFSYFYTDDGEDEALDALCRDTGIDPEECLIYLDGAIDQLAKANLVVIRVTKDVLPDGNPDYESGLTDAGRAFIASGEEFHFDDVDLLEDPVPILPWRQGKDDPNDKFRHNLEFNASLITSSIDFHRERIEGEQFGVLDLKLGSAILIFGKRPTGVKDPDDVLLRRALAVVRDGLGEAGAEEICNFVFGIGYIVLAKPAGIPLYDPRPMEAEQLWTESKIFEDVVSRLRELVQKASRATDYVGQ